MQHREYASGSAAVDGQSMAVDVQPTDRKAGRDARSPEGSSLDAAIRASRLEIAHGKRVRFRVRGRVQDDGSYRVAVLDLPGVVLSVTGRKGVEAAARARIGLLLELPEDAFDVVVEPSRWRHPRVARHGSVPGELRGTNGVPRSDAPGHETS